MIETILVGMLVTIGGGIGLYYWQSRVVDRISIRRIKSSTDDHIAGLLDLYGTLFPEDDGTNYSLEEVVEFMDAKYEAKHHVEVENINLVAVLKDEVIGFIFCHLYPERRKAIVSYFAINKENAEARLRGARRLLTKLKDILIKGDLCDALFFDLQGFDSTTSKTERSERRARRVLFKQNAKSFGLKAREFQFSYYCPKVSMSEGAHEYPFSLYCIGIRDQIPDQVSKQQMLEYLRFIYLDCYGDLYPLDDPRFEEYQKHLRNIVEQYENTLPEVVPAI
jgi:hypothetical protein